LGRFSHDPNIGCARVSTLDQNLAQDALKEAGCEKIFIEQMSGAVTDRPALREVLEYARSGDTLVVWKLDRLARSMKQLIETIEKLRLAPFRRRLLCFSTREEPPTKSRLAL
jgi:DNA invertase Pin-like site-specific DNA recombinase